MTPESLERAMTLPEIQPDRAWAEHLGVPHLIAEIERLREELEEAYQRQYDLANGS